MKLFSKKKEIIKTDNEEFDIEKRKLNKIKNKEFKDLKPQNKEKRKEVEKPWGKRERIIVLSVFMTTAIASALLTLSSKNWKLPGLPQIKPFNINIGFLKDETVYDGYSNNSKKTKNIIDKFNSDTLRLSGIYSMYIIRINDGSGFGINETNKMQAASLIKLPVILTAYWESERGKFDLDEIHVLSKEDKRSGSGSLFSEDIGYEITYRRLLALMCKQSDNTAFNIIRNKLGDEKIMELIQKTGMSDTDLTDNITTAYDVALFFESLWKGQLLNDDSKNEIISNLTDTIYENYLPSGLPDETKIAHKYGAEINVINDCGIVFSNSPYILCIMGEGITKSEADIFIPEFSKFVYEIEQGVRD